MRRIKWSFPLLLVSGTIAVLASLFRVNQADVSRWSLEGVCLGMRRETVERKFKTHGRLQYASDSHTEIYRTRKNEETVDIEFKDQVVEKILRAGTGRSVTALTVIDKNDQTFLLRPKLIEADVLKVLGEPISKSQTSMRFKAAYQSGIRVVFSNDSVTFVDGHRLERDGRLIVDEWSSLEDLQGFLGKPMQLASMSFLYQLGYCCISGTFDTEGCIKVISLSHQQTTTPGTAGSLENTVGGGK